jgi:hypothetical protein
VYFVDNFDTKAPSIDENKDETPNQDNNEIAIINLYDEACLKNLFRNIKFRDDMFVYTNLQVSTRHLSAKKWNAHCCGCVLVCLMLPFA